MSRLSTVLMGASVAAIFAGCATPYQPRGLAGGYADTRLAADTFRVEFFGNAYTSRAQVETGVLVRAAELTLQHGYDSFVLLGGDTDRQSTAVTLPGTYTATTTGYATGSAQRVGNFAYGSAYGSSTTVGSYTPGSTLVFTNYGVTALVRAFRGQQPGGLGAFDAREVLRYAGRPMAAPDPPRVAAPSPAAITTAAPQPRWPADTKPPDLTGTYRGSVSGAQRGRALWMGATFTLVQQEARLLGTWTTDAGTSGTMEGRVSSDGVIEFALKQMNPCPAEFLGRGTIEEGGRTLRGSYEGEGCGGPVNASVEAIRQ